MSYYCILHSKCTNNKHSYSHTKYKYVCMNACKFTVKNDSQICVWTKKEHFWNFDFSVEQKWCNLCSSSSHFLSWSLIMPPDGNSLARCIIMGCIYHFTSIHLSSIYESVTYYVQLCECRKCENHNLSLAHKQKSSTNGKYNFRFCLS